MKENITELETKKIENVLREFLEGATEGAKVVAATQSQITDLAAITSELTDRLLALEQDLDDLRKNRARLSVKKGGKV